jgi:hypothetical protein
MKLVKEEREHQRVTAPTENVAGRGLCSDGSCRCGAGKWFASKAGVVACHVRKGQRQLQRDDWLGSVGPRLERPQQAAAPWAKSRKLMEALPAAAQGKGEAGGIKSLSASGLCHDHNDSE